MFRRVLIKTAAVLAAGAVAVDRLAAAVAGRRVADRIASSESLADPPTVSFGGGPFLIQALRGRYTDVSVTARDLRRGPVLIARIEARLHGVRLRLVDALRGRLGAVAIDSAQATALLRYADLAAALPNRAITLSEENGRIRLHGAAVVFGQRIAGSALGEIVLDGHRLTIVPRDFTLDAGGRTVALNPTLAAALTYAVPVNLPLGLRLRSVQPRPEGVLVQAFGDALVLPAGLGSARVPGRFAATGGKYVL